MESRDDIHLSVSESKTYSESYDPSSAFRIIEDDFNQTIEELIKHDRLGHYANEFQRVLDALRESHFREHEIIDKYRVLKMQLETQALKLSEAVKTTQGDRDTIEKLEKELTKAWKMVDTAHTREQLAQEVIENLRLQGARLTQELETMRKMGTDQDQEVGALSKNKEALVREKERLLGEIAHMRERNAITLKYQEELEKKLDTAETKLSEVTTELESQKSELAKEKRFRENLEEEMKELKNDFVTKEQELQNQTNQTTQNTKLLVKLEMQLREEKLTIDKQVKELQELQNTIRLNKMEQEQLMGNNERLQQDLTSKTQELKLKEDEMIRLKNDLKKLTAFKDSLENKLALLLSEKGMLEIKKKDIETKVVALEKEVLELTKTVSSDKSIIDNMNREKIMMTRMVQKSTAFTQEQQKQLNLQELNKKKMREELHDTMETVGKLQSELSALRNEKDRLLSESVALNTQIQDHLEDLKLKEMELYDCKKKISNTEAKIKLHMSMYEQVRSERNQLSKNLSEANDEITELKHKLKVKTYQGEQLKEDIMTKENLLVKEELATKKVAKEKEEVIIELQRTLTELKEKRVRVKLLTQEESKLQKIIQEADKDRMKLNKDLSQVSNERDILGTQLVRRNDELSLLYEKIKILQTVLEKGEAQYGQRLEDIRLLKIEIKKLRQEKLLLKRNINNMADLRQEIFHLEKDFTRERLKCRALEEELQNPLNIHRWRKLEGSDPSTYELIQKVQILQRRLLKASEDAIKRESQLKETERQYLNLKQINEKQPGPENFEKLRKCQNAYKQRGIKMKCLIAELTMYENQVTGYKFEQENKNKEIVQLKKKYFALKKREQKVKQKEKELLRESNFLPVLEPITGKPTKLKFIGAGFNVASISCMPRPPSVSA